MSHRGDIFSALECLARGSVQHNRKKKFVLGKLTPCQNYGYLSAEFCF